MDDLTKINDGMSGRPSAAKGDRPPKADKPPKWDQRLSRAEVERAVGTLIRWTGDGHAREGLRDTPARVARAYEEWFAGYGEDPRQLMQRTFEEIGGYDEMVLLRDIRFVSHCEHHLGADGSAGVARADILRRQETFHSMAT